MPEDGLVLLRPTLLHPFDFSINILMDYFSPNFIHSSRNLASIIEGLSELS
jgi:hypothetical protein